MEAKPAEKPALAGDEVEWMWPANGKLIAPYTEGASKGLDIAGKAGDPVLAAASGVVSYAGAGLREFGRVDRHFLVAEGMLWRGLGWLVRDFDGRGRFFGRFRHCVDPVGKRFTENSLAR